MFDGAQYTRPIIKLTDEILKEALKINRGGPEKPGMARKTKGLFALANRPIY
jgi:hypothetical protein